MQVVNRINKRLVTFQFPFFIDDIGKQLPAGDYTIETEEKTVVGSSFLACLHIETILVERPLKGKSNTTSYWPVDHNALAQAIKADSDRVLETNRNAANNQKISNREIDNE
jgi:hypothetical protein